jgi:hypothetical protein
MPPRWIVCAQVAQSVEHFLGKEEVTDSSSVLGSIGTPATLGFAKALTAKRRTLMRESGFARRAGAGAVEDMHVQVRPLSCGEVPEWLKGADCKSAGSGLRWFESTPHHHFPPSIFIQPRFC